MDESDAKLKWHDRLFYALFVFVLLGMPWIAVAVIGSGLTWYNFTVLHHVLWRSLLYGFWLPLLLLALNYWFYKGSPNTRNEMGCMFAILWLTLFFVLWPVFIRAAHRHSQQPGMRRQSTLASP